MKLRYFFTLVAVALLSSSAISQALTVREIMAEPSIVGMRVQGEKLSPEKVTEVSKWPNRAGQISIVLGQILSPGSKLLSQLNGPGGKLLSQIKQKSEGEEKTA